MAAPNEAAQGFPPRLRLRRTADYRRVQRRGRRHHSELLVTVHATNGLDHPRFGLTVSRKVGNAVVRNQVKRWLREAIRRHPAAHDASLAGTDVVFIARSQAARIGYVPLQEAVATAIDAVLRERRPYAPSAHGA
jgi:ribonuclease P protein component